MPSLAHTTSSICLGAHERGSPSHFIAKTAGAQSGDRAWLSEGAWQPLGRTWGPHFRAQLTVCQLNILPGLISSSPVFTHPSDDGLLAIFFSLNKLVFALAKPFLLKGKPHHQGKQEASGL